MSPRGPPRVPGVADAAQRHVLARRDAGRNLHRDFVIAAHATFAATLLARRLDDAPFAVAGRARRDGDELAEERSLRASHLTDARARRARLRLGSRLGAAARRSVRRDRAA